jgi:type II secretion system protein H
MAPRVGRNCSRLGFTLTELMVVLVLIGIMAAMVVPEMKGTYEHELLRSAGRTLVSVFHLASARAIALNQLHCVRLNLQTGHYSVERPFRAGEGESGFGRARDLPVGHGTLDPRILIEFRGAGEDPSPTWSEDQWPSLSENPLTERRGEEVIAFFPDGTADAGEIVLRDREGFGLALRINPITARVQVVELEPQ